MCDTLCALGPATVTGEALFGKNSDRPPTEPQRLEWFPPRRDAGPVRCTHVDVAPVAGDTIGFLGSRPDWMWGVEHGVNEAGVAIGNEAVYTVLDPRDSPPALTGMDLVRLALERAATAAAAVAVIETALDRYGQGGPCHPGGERPYWSSFLVADPVEAFVVETSGTERAIDRVDRTRAISNRTSIPEFDRRHGISDLAGDVLAVVVDPRLAASRAVLDRGPLSVDRLKRHLRSHTGGPDGWTVCMHVEGQEATTASMIATLSGDRPRARALLGAPCTSVYVPLPVGHAIGPTPAWERFTLLGPEHRGALDDLEAELERDATFDRDWPAEAWRRVDARLEDLVGRVGAGDR